MPTEEHPPTPEPETPAADSPPPEEAGPAEVVLDPFDPELGKVLPWVAEMEEAVKGGAKLSVPREEIDRFAEDPSFKAWFVNMRQLANKQSEANAIAGKALATEKSKLEATRRDTLVMRDNLVAQQRQLRELFSSPDIQKLLAVEAPKGGRPPDPMSKEGLDFYGKKVVSDTLKAVLDKLSGGAGAMIAEAEERAKEAQLAEDQANIQAFFDDVGDAHAYIDKIEELMTKHATLDVRQAYDIAKAQALRAGPPPAPAKRPGQDARAQARKVEREVKPPSKDKKPLTLAEANRMAAEDPAFVAEQSKKAGSRYWF